jgi:hypothetical protein
VSQSVKTTHAQPPARLLATGPSGPPPASGLGNKVESVAKSPRSVVRKPNLVIRQDDLTTTAQALAPIVAASGRVFDRAGPTKVVPSAGGGPPRAVPLTIQGVVKEAHLLARPVLRNSTGEPSATTLPERVARLYLDPGDWGLMPLKGITTAPLLAADGSIRAAEGYDPQLGLWCANLPAITLPMDVTEDQARAALHLLRGVFRTFPFADAPTAKGLGEAPRGVDFAAPPALDESTFLAGLLTAICRPSLPLAPGLLIAAPSISGAGTGKGLLVRAICAVAYGVSPHAFTAGRDEAELDKRLTAALIAAAPAIFLDNFNGTALRSDLLASLLTEPQVEVRPLGTSRMLPLCPCAFVAVTGNGLTLSEDLTRRFLLCELDARTEDPEQRAFAPGFLEDIAARRAELLAAALTIWRWGRLNPGDLKRGRPLGSFEDWARWVRDPLLTLGCADPVERLAAIKSNDPLRHRLAEILETWHRIHGSKPVFLADLAAPVVALIDPQGRGRQLVQAEAQRLVGTRVNGFSLTSQKPPGKWSKATYAVSRVEGGTL